MNQSDTTAISVAVFTTVSMEACVRAWELPVALTFATESVSMETQQLDEVDARNALLKHHERLRDLLKAEKPTGAVHLFVLDPNELASGAHDSHTTLQALADAQFNSNQAVAAALIPATGNVTADGEVAVDLIKQTLEGENITTLESLDEVRAWLTKQSA